MPKSDAKQLSLRKIDVVDKKRQFMFRLIIGVVVITAVIFLSFKYLLKGPPFVKVMAVGLVAATGYLVVDNLIKKAKENE